VLVDSTRVSSNACLHVFIRPERFEAFEALEAFEVFEVFEIFEAFGEIPNADFLPWISSKVCHNLQLKRSIFIHGDRTFSRSHKIGVFIKRFLDVLKDCFIDVSSCTT
jgi:hypothetical protein